MSKVLSGVSTTLNEKLVQISLTGAVLFYIVASPALFDFVKKMIKKLLGVFGVDFELEGMQLVLFHCPVRQPHGNSLIAIKAFAGQKYFHAVMCA